MTRERKRIDKNLPADPHPFDKRRGALFNGSQQYCLKTLGETAP
jgi:hypothetical protein